MAKLSDEVLREGRLLLSRWDLDGFSKWIDKNHILIDKGVVHRTFTACMLAGDPAKALRIFNQTFPEIDPTKDAALAVGKLIGCLLMVVVVLGALGGLVYLVKALLS